MITIAFTVFFASAGLIALTSITVTLRRFGASALRLRAALRACPQEQELRYSVTEFRQSPWKKAQILRPDFRPKAPARLAPAQLHAAA